MYKVDSNGDIEIIIHVYKKFKGNYYLAGSYPMNITTTEDLKGITRDIMHINAYTSYDDGLSPSENKTTFKGITSYAIRSNTGLNQEEKLKKENPLVYGLSLFMLKNPLGTGYIVEAMTGKDAMTGEVLGKSGVAGKLIESAISMVSLGRANSAAKLFTGWLADVGVEEGLAKGLLNDDNIENGNLYGKLTNFIYATYKMKNIDIKEKF
jgi:hypothetical protein